MNIEKNIKKETDIEYLKNLERYIDMDIENAGKDSDMILKMKAKMFNTTVENFVQKRIDSLNNLKKTVQKRIQELE